MDVAEEMATQLPSLAAAVGGVAVRTEQQRYVVVAACVGHFEYDLKTSTVV